MQKMLSEEHKMHPIKKKNAERAATLTANINKNYVIFMLAKTAKTIKIGKEVNRWQLEQSHITH